MSAEAIAQQAAAPTGAVEAESNQLVTGANKLLESMADQFAIAPGMVDELLATVAPLYTRSPEVATEMVKASAEQMTAPADAALAEMSGFVEDLDSLITEMTSTSLAGWVEPDIIQSLMHLSPD